MPPVLTFQSVVDFTVSTQAVVSALYGNLPANGSELVLFDVNRNARLGPLLRSASRTRSIGCCRHRRATSARDHRQRQPECGRRGGARHRAGARPNRRVGSI